MDDDYGDVKQAPAVYEDDYPQHDRRNEGWHLIGFTEATEKTRRSLPVWRYHGWAKSKKYTGASLRAIRKAQTLKALKGSSANV